MTRPRQHCPAVHRGAERQAAGFTLTEVLIVVAIVAVLTTIAVPGYAGYIQRSRILEAVARLADASARMQEYFLDERSYVDASGSCGIPAAASAASDAFTLTCAASGSTFVYTAAGRADKGMSAFIYAIDETGAKKTLSLPTGWSRSADCWTIRADGLCA